MIHLFSLLLFMPLFSKFGQTPEWYRNIIFWAEALVITPMTYPGLKAGAIENFLNMDFSPK